MTDYLSKADRDVWREQCAPLSPGIVQPTADAMVIALCAHADAMDALLDECAEVLKAVEYGDTDGEIGNIAEKMCPVCGVFAIHNTHLNDCRLAALIAKLEGR